MTEAAVLVLGYGPGARRYPVDVVTRGSHYAWVRFISDCAEMKAKAGDPQLVSVDVIELVA